MSHIEGPHVITYRVRNSDGGYRWTFIAAFYVFKYLWLFILWIISLF